MPLSRTAMGSSSASTSACSARASARWSTSSKDTGLPARVRSPGLAGEPGGGGAIDDPALHRVLGEIAGAEALGSAAGFTESRDEPLHRVEVGLLEGDPLGERERAADPLGPIVGQLEERLELVILGRQAIGPVDLRHQRPKAIRGEPRPGPPGVHGAERVAHDLVPERDRLAWPWPTVRGPRLADKVLVKVEKGASEMAW